MRLSLQMLALLNLYPFEQYIHIETCQSEMQEGLCRPGCRSILTAASHHYFKLFNLLLNSVCRPLGGYFFLETLIP